MTRPVHILPLLLAVCCGCGQSRVGGQGELTLSSAGGAQQDANVGVLVAQDVGQPAAGLVVSTFSPGAALAAAQATGLSGLAAQLAALASLGAGAAGPSFIDGDLALTSTLKFSGSDSDSIGSLLGLTGAAAAAAGSQPLGTALVDARGWIYFPAAGSYTFSLSTTNVGAAIFLAGQGGHGSGTKVVEAADVGEVAAAEPYVVAAAGWQPFELLWYHVAGGTSAPVALSFSASGPRTVVFRTQQGEAPKAVAMPGLSASVWHLPGSTPSAGNLAPIFAYAAANPPSSTFVDGHLTDSTGIQLNTPNPPGTTAAMLGGRASGAASFDGNVMVNTLLDYQGTITFSAAGSYTFSFSYTDDLAAIYLDGSGVPGSGQQLLQAYFPDGSQSAVLEVAAPGSRAFELAYVNFLYAGILNMTVVGPQPVTFTSRPTLPPTPEAVVGPSASLPQVTLGGPTRVVLPAIADAATMQNATSSPFPYLANLAGSANLTFWSAGRVFRSQGPSLTQMAAPVPAGPVLDVGPAEGFAASGVWLTQVTRLPDGSLAGHVRGERHSFSDGSTGVWASSGLATSSDDGASWALLGQTVGLPQPQAAAQGGRALACSMYDSGSHTWLGIAGGQGFRSQVSVPVPGSWRSWDGTAFSQVEPDATGSNSVAVLPGLTAGLADCGLSYNAYLGAYLLVWREAGGGALHLSSSQNFTHWGPSVDILAVPAGVSVAYPQLIGASEVATGQDNLLVYEQTPSSAGRGRDMVVRSLHLGP